MDINLGFNRIHIFLLVISLLSVSCSKVYGQEFTRDYGKQDFEKHCSSCHGTDGSGNGWLSHFLTQEPPNLRFLATQNGGIFPVERLYNSVVGNQVTIHGPSEMPAWGSTFRAEAKEQNIGSLYDPEAIAKARILLLLEYVNRLQVK